MTPTPEEIATRWTMESRQKDRDALAAEITQALTAKDVEIAALRQQVAEMTRDEINTALMSKAEMDELREQVEELQRERDGYREQWQQTFAAMYEAQAEADAAESALSAAQAERDEAQEEVEYWITAGLLGDHAAQAEMRERAAQVVDDAGWLQVADKIRALPLTPASERDEYRPEMVEELLRLADSGNAASPPNPAAQHED